MNDDDEDIGMNIQLSNEENLNNTKSKILNFVCPFIAAACHVLRSFSWIRKSFAMDWNACENSKFLFLILAAV